METQSYEFVFIMLVYDTTSYMSMCASVDSIISKIT